MGRNKEVIVVNVLETISPINIFSVIFALIFNILQVNTPEIISKKIVTIADISIAIMILYSIYCFLITHITDNPILLQNNLSISL